MLNRKSDMRVLVTGSKGFIGKNLVVRLNELEGYELFEFNRGDSLDCLKVIIFQVDVIIHLAGENRPKKDEDFNLVNLELTRFIVNEIARSDKKTSLIFASSTQAKLDNPYGKSKRAAEECIKALGTDNPTSVYRLPGVFGKWCRPNYNSVVATFCHNVANEIPIEINDRSASVHLVHVDDVVNEFIRALQGKNSGHRLAKVDKEYSITLDDLASQIQSFRNCRDTLILGKVGEGFIRALYSTYVSYLPPEKFMYDLPQYGDERGTFVEMLKTTDSGQFSYFSALPGVTRGGHYHHTKTEKFLVIKGKALFKFRHILTDEISEIVVVGGHPQVVETVPGWSHDVTNIGDAEMFVMLWANEVFDRARPDTIASKV